MEEQLSAGESLDITTATARASEWQKILDSDQPRICLNVDNLSNVDTAGLQLLLALKRDATKHGRSFAISGTSEILEREATVLGLTQLLR